MIKALSDNIQALIKIRGIQVGKLEKQLGVSAGYFSRVRRGMSISSEVLYKLSKAVDVSMDDLCSEGYKNRLVKEERPQGDLISREALKKAFEDTVCIEPMPYAFVKQIIDNAPTVEPFEPDYVGAERVAARQRGYEEGYHNGMRIGKTLNPKIKQGEWIDHSEDYGYAECPFCEHLTNCEGNIDELHFCWNCGAELRKGGEVNEDS